MLPVIAEVVDVNELQLLLKDSFKFDPSGILAVEVEFRIWYAIEDTTYRETIEMIILPSHGRLHDLVKLVECDAAWNSEPSPDWRIDSQKRDLKLECGLREIKFLFLAVHKQYLYRGD